LLMVKVGSRSKGREPYFLGRKQIMRAVVLVEPGRLESRHVDDPPCPPGGVVVKVMASLICSTDLHMWRRGHPALRYPRILGHEMAGVIVDLSPESRHLRVGDRVHVYPGIPCGACRFCRQGRENLCPSLEIMGFTSDGGFAEYVSVSGRAVATGALSPIPSALSLATAALAEPVACCLNGLERAGFKEGQTVLLLGGGPIGCLLAVISRHFGAGRVMVVENSSTRARLAAAVSGVEALDPGTGNVLEAVRDLTGGKGADLVVTCFREAALRYPLLELVEPAGEVLCFSGLPGAEREILLDLNRIHYRELTVTGAYGCTSAQCGEALQLLSGDLKASWLISHRLGLDDLVKGLELVALQRAMKVCVEPWGEEDVESCLVR
jgi:L-iditol 2-dehydrogenase